jgi:hypothetical protein
MVPTITHMKRQHIARARARSSASSPALLSFTVSSLSSAETTTTSGSVVFIVGDIDGAAVGVDGAAVGIADGSSGSNTVVGEMVGAAPVGTCEGP